MGVVQANAVVDALKEWNGNDCRVVATCFDTTVANTGHVRGACTFTEEIEKKSPKPPFLIPYFGSCS